VITIDIPADVREAIYEHAHATYPDECCGYLVGPRDGTRVDGTVICRNAQRDPSGNDTGSLGSLTQGRGADTAFVIDGAELFAFARALDGDRPPRVLYHSHTNGRAYFSELDRQAAGVPPFYPVQHLVIGVTAEGLTEAAQFAWSEDERDFVEVARWQIDKAAPVV